MSRTAMLWVLWITVSAAGGLYVLGSIVYAAAIAIRYWSTIGV